MARHNSAGIGSVLSVRSDKEPIGSHATFAINSLSCLLERHLCCNNIGSFYGWFTPYPSAVAWQSLDTSHLLGDLYNVLFDEE